MYIDYNFNFSLNIFDKNKIIYDGTNKYFLFEEAKFKLRDI
jgi:hypothetical protein